MRTLGVLAACATLALLAAACGDDDDGSGGTSPEPVSASPTPTSAAARVATQPPAQPEPPRAVSSEGGSVEASSDIDADCQTVGTALLSLGAFPENPEVGDQISDEFKAAVQSAVDDFEGLDLQTDEVQSAVGSFVSYLDRILAADSWTEELANPSDNPGGPLREICGPTFTEMGSTGTS
jgi:hypothetical protein